MSLVPDDPAQSIWDAQQSIASLNADGTPKRDGSGTTIPPSLTFEEMADAYATAFSESYDSYAKAGVLPPSAVSGTEDPSILYNFLNSPLEKDPLEFGQALADYWATVKLAPGTAVQLDVVVSVVNDASAKLADFQAAVEASITTQLGTPPYYTPFIQNVELVAKTVIWTITEQDTSTGATTTYTATIT